MLPGSRGRWCDKLKEPRAFWLECKLAILRYVAKIFQRQDAARVRINFLVNEERAARMLRSIRRAAVITQFFQPVEEGNQSGQGTIDLTNSDD